MHLRILLANLLQIQPASRFGVAEIKESKWFDKIDWNDIFQRKTEPPKVSFRQTEKLDQPSDTSLSNFSFQLNPEEEVKDEFYEF